MGNIKAKHIHKSWLEMHGEFTSDHLEFSLSLMKSLVENGPINLADFSEKVSIPMRRLKKLLQKRHYTNFNEDRLMIQHSFVHAEQSPVTLIDDNYTYYANSAWESLCLSELFDTKMDLKANCAISGKEITIKVTPLGYETLLDEVFVSFKDLLNFNTGDLSSIRDWSVFILGTESAEKYVEENEGMILLPLSIAYQSSRDCATDLYQLD